MWSLWIKTNEISRLQNSIIELLDVYFEKIVDKVRKESLYVLDDAIDKLGKNNFTTFFSDNSADEGYCFIVGLDLFFSSRVA